MLADDRERFEALLFGYDIDVNERFVLPGTPSNRTRSDCFLTLSPANFLLSTLLMYSLRRCCLSLRSCWYNSSDFTTLAHAAVENRKTQYIQHLFVVSGCSRLALGGVWQRCLVRVACRRNPSS